MTAPFHPKRECIFIWARGGGGHKAVMDAKKQEWAEKGSYTLIDKDIMGDDFLNMVSLPFLGRLGDFCADVWNNAQSQGNVFVLRFFSSLQPLLETFFSSFVYTSLKRMLLSREFPVECVIDSQPLCTRAIARAIRDVNKIRNWNIRLDLWMTDMPTDKAKHFFSSLRAIGKDPELKEIVTLYAPPAYHVNGEAERIFWRKYCGEVKVITDQPFPIRKRFLSQQCLLGKNVDLKIPQKDGSFESFSISAQDRVATLMLGSHPSNKAVLEYIDVMIKIANERLVKDQNEKEPFYYFFVYCGNRMSAHVSNLLDNVQQKVKSNVYPTRLKIIPFTFLGDEDLAPLMARSDVTLTRSGGSTCMELLHLNRENKRLTLIHSEVEDFFSERKMRLTTRLKIGKVELHRAWFARPIASSVDKCIQTFRGTFLSRSFDRRDHEKELISRGILLWEAGNAEYLKETIGAKVVSPKHIDRVLREVFFCHTADGS